MGVYVLLSLKHGGRRALQITGYSCGQSTSTTRGVELAYEGQNFSDMRTCATECSFGICMTAQGAALLHACAQLERDLTSKFACMQTWNACIPLVNVECMLIQQLWVSLEFTIAAVMGVHICRHKQG